MILKKLGRSGKGVKSFELISDDENGYNITLSDNEGVIIYNKVTSIDWMYKGATVYLTPNPIEGKAEYDFIRFDKVIIEKAEKKEDVAFVHRYHSE